SLCRAPSEVGAEPSAGRSCNEGRPPLATPPSQRGNEPDCGLRPTGKARTGGPPRQYEQRRAGRRRGIAEGVGYWSPRMGLARRAPDRTPNRDLSSGGEPSASSCHSARRLPFESITRSSSPPRCGNDGPPPEGWLRDAIRVSPASPDRSVVRFRREAR